MSKHWTLEGEKTRKGFGVAIFLIGLTAISVYALTR